MSSIQRNNTCLRRNAYPDLNFIQCMSVLKQHLTLHKYVQLTHQLKSRILHKNFLSSILCSYLLERQRESEHAHVTEKHRQRDRQRESSHPLVYCLSAHNSQDLAGVGTMLGTRYSIQVSYIVAGLNYLSHPKCSMDLQWQEKAARSQSQKLKLGI